MNRELATVVRRFADRQTSQLADIPATPMFLATVATVTAGAAADGNALVEVTWRGSVLVANAYPDSYTPAVTDRVLCALVNSQVVIVMHGIGYP